jgi:hypothetical protein
LEKARKANWKATTADGEEAEIEKETKKMENQPYRPQLDPKLS